MRKSFLQHEAERILANPISHGFLEDSQVWALTKNGEFSVRSAYGVAIKTIRETRKQREEGGTSDSSTMAKVWKSIWSLNCPNKTKHFIWSACRNILPTNHALKRRKVALTDECGLCGACETSSHVLVQCNITAEVWKEMGIQMPMGCPTQMEFIDVFWNIMEKQKGVDLKLLAVTAWGL